jgi:hypothetical protein
MELGARPEVVGNNPVEAAGAKTRDCTDGDHEAPAAVAVYSMLWIYQLALASPKVPVAVEFIMEKVGAERAEATTQVHLSVTENA